MNSTKQLSVRQPSLSEQLAKHPERLLDVVLNKLRLRSDAALARTFGVTPASISHIRRRKQPLSQPVLVRMLEETQLHIRELYQDVACWIPSQPAAPVRMRPDWTQGLNSSTATILLKQGYGSRNEVQSALDRGERMPYIGEVRRQELLQWLGIPVKSQRRLKRHAERKARPARERLPGQSASTQAGWHRLRLSEQIVENPDELLDAVIDKLHLKNDAALARVLGVAPPMISKIRHRKLSVGGVILLRLLEETQLHLRELYQLVESRLSSESATGAGAQDMTQAAAVALPRRT